MLILKSSQRSDFNNIYCTYLIEEGRKDRSGASNCFSRAVASLSDPVSLVQSQWRSIRTYSRSGTDLMPILKWILFCSAVESAFLDDDSGPSRNAMLLTFCRSDRWGTESYLCTRYICRYIRPNVRTDRYVRTYFKPTLIQPELPKSRLKPVNVVSEIGRNDLPAGQYQIARLFYSIWSSKTNWLARLLFFNSGINEISGHGTPWLDWANSVLHHTVE